MLEDSPDQAAASGPATAAETIDEPQPTAEPYDRLELLRRDLEAVQQYRESLLESLSVEPPQIPVPDDYLERFEPGLPLRENWMNCTRYRTNNATAGFCEDQPPASWRPFMFNDQRYFVVPLGPSA